MDVNLIIAFSLLLAGFLCSSVGQGGAIGIIAVLSFFSVATLDYKSYILIINIVIAAIAFIQFYRKGHFYWPIMWAFLLTSIPFAYLGATLELSGTTHNVVIGIILVFLAVLVWRHKQGDRLTNRPVDQILALIIGGLIGFSAGILGIGGGILLGPILILMEWAKPKEAAAVSSLFVLLNSTSALMGNGPDNIEITATLYMWCIAAMIGGVLGSYFGSTRFSQNTHKYVFGSVLMIASVKLIFF